MFTSFIISKKNIERACARYHTKCVFPFVDNNRSVTMDGFQKDVPDVIQYFSLW